MSREEIIAALAELGIETSEAHTDEELLALLDAATSADTADGGEIIGDGSGEQLPDVDADVERVGEGTGEVAEAVPNPVPDPAPAKGKGRAAKPSASEHVTCVLGSNSTVGALVVGNARIEARKSAVIPRSEFDRLKAEYDLREVEG